MAKQGGDQCIAAFAALLLAKRMADFPRLADVPELTWSGVFLEHVTHLYSHRMDCPRNRRLHFGGQAYMLKLCAERRFHDRRSIHMSDNHQSKHPFYEETISTKPIFEGRIIDLRVDTVRLPNGDTAMREIIRHPGAVAVVALLDGKLLVVEQYRKALEKAQVEIPAGKLDGGEAPETAALRELEEETGYKAAKLAKLSEFSTSPGFADEVIHLYVATELSQGEVHLDDEEFLTCEAITLEQALTYVQEGRICDAKTLMAVYAWRLYTLTGSWA